jgi:bud site selection protein 20
MGSAGRSKKTGSGGKGSSALHKRGVRKKFRARHIDQVWEDVRKPDGVVTATHGPLGTMVGELDEDVPGRGKWYCAACSRYFSLSLSLSSGRCTSGG